MTLIIDKQSELKLLAKSIFAGVATVDDFAQVPPSEVLAIKSDTSEPRTVYSVVERAQKGTGDRVRRFKTSVERADRSGDIVRIKGIDLSDYRKNPMVVWCHATRELPLGVGQDFEKDTKSDPPTLFQSCNFHTEDLYPFADQVMRFVDAGGIRATSISFIPKAGGVKVPATPEEREASGLGPWGVDYTQSSQLEFSICVVPCNPDTLASKSMVEKAIGEMVAEKRISEAHAKQLLAATEGPKVFAVAHVAGDEGHSAGKHAGAAKTSPIEPVEVPDTVAPALEVIGKSLEAITQVLQRESARGDRIESLEREVAELKTKANGSTVATSKQEPAAVTTRADASAFYAQALEGLGCRN